ncbi:hypothetical protein [Azospirillum sp. TSO22-1]|uniref:hypothetical protein n=1 Tax=Azospirillum sp. TSO22-1 TaxID=716789 RepID=UPI000D61048A|nr:hypothetical protein [Azospirillum sp. TSO22-1]PWC53634.1 hypothetical protein TSO221_10435 [Azospirillum sp. TSO22-1]
MTVMTAVSRRIADLTAQETTIVRHAYDAGRLHEDHDGAFSLAMSVLRGLRPGLPLALLAAELDGLLTNASVG